MKVLVLGSADQQEEFAAKFPELPHTTVLHHDALADLDLQQYDLVVDFLLEDYPEDVACYDGEGGLLVLCNCVKSSLAELLYLFDPPEATLIGFNGLPTFFNRPLLELSLYREEDRALVTKLCEQLGTDYELVSDRVGMVTPRVICMIINEAYYTLQEGTASKADIDQGMKLGTNYPYGPFEWAERIGLDHVYDLLEALWEDTRDERYKICPLLKRDFFMLG